MEIELAELFQVKGQTIGVPTGLVRKIIHNKVTAKIWKHLTLPVWGRKAGM